MNIQTDVKVVNTGHNVSTSLDTKPYANDPNNNTVDKNSADDIKTSWFLNLWILLILVRKNFGKFLGFNVSFLIFLIPAFQALLLCVIYDRDSIPVSCACSSSCDLIPRSFDRSRLPSSTKSLSPTTVFDCSGQSRKWTPIT